MIHDITTQIEYYLHKGLSLVSVKKLLILQCKTPTEK